MNAMELKRNRLTLPRVRWAAAFVAAAVVASLLATAPAQSGPQTTPEVVNTATAAPLEFTQDDQGLKVKTPPQGARKYAFGLKISGLNMNSPDDPIPSTMAGLRN